jgi:hypothetical protein
MNIGTDLDPRVYAEPMSPRVVLAGGVPGLADLPFCDGVHCFDVSKLLSHDWQLPRWLLGYNFSGGQVFFLDITLPW